MVDAPRRVSLSPSAASITIIDSENQTRVRFEDGSLSRRVLENEGTISLCVEAFGGGGASSQFDVSVDFVGGTAGMLIVVAALYQEYVIKERREYQMCRCSVLNDVESHMLGMLII